ncbi:MAG TPA: cupin domain-containing protein [Candidatus Eisenbacteria bacterium]|nr:cupin domain-containing protein [Candidatus Eisenbacteria bacterium]
MNSETTTNAGKFPSAESVAADGLLQYQQGAVVSRIVLKEAAGSVTLFAFDEAQGLSEHTSPRDALVYVMEGRAEIRILGEPVSAKAGDLVWMPANQRHSVQAVTRFKMMLTLLRP